MSTLFSYLLAIILQFIGLNMVDEQKTFSTVIQQHCEEVMVNFPQEFTIVNIQDLKKPENGNL